MKKVQIIVTDLGAGDEKVVANFECDDYSVSESRGTIRHGSVNHALKISYNGQARLEFQAWRGCPDYDSFESGQPNLTKE